MNAPARVRSQAHDVVREDRPNEDLDDGVRQPGDDRRQVERPPRVELVLALLEEDGQPCHLRSVDSKP